MQAVLQTLVKDKPVAQVQDCALKGGALNGFELIGLIALLLDLFQERRKFREAEIFSLALFPSKQAEYFVVLNEKRRILIGRGRVKQNVGQPLNRAERVTVFESKLLLSMQDQQ